MSNATGVNWGNEDLGQFYLQREMEMKGSEVYTSACVTLSAFACRLDGMTLSRGWSP